MGHILLFSVCFATVGIRLTVGDANCLKINCEHYMRLTKSPGTSPDRRCIQFRYYKSCLGRCLRNMSKEEAMKVGRSWHPEDFEKFEAKCNAETIACVDACTDHLEAAKSKDHSAACEPFRKYVDCIKTCAVMVDAAAWGIGKTRDPKIYQALDKQCFGGPKACIGKCEKKFCGKGSKSYRGDYREYKTCVRVCGMDYGDKVFKMGKSRDSLSKECD